jgi:hypothetical protein
VEKPIQLEGGETAKKLLDYDNFDSNNLNHSFD